nr:outer envelope protein 80, chloroplastic-like [Ipomoea batatas]
MIRLITSDSVIPLDLWRRREICREGDGDDGVETAAAATETIVFPVCGDGVRSVGKGAEMKGWRRLRRRRRRGNTHDDMLLAKLETMYTGSGDSGSSILSLCLLDLSGRSNLAV